MRNRTLAWILLISSMVLLLGACRPRKKEGDTASVSQDKSQVSREARAPREPKTHAPRSPETGRSRDAASAVRAFAWKGDPLFAPPGNFIFPQDFTLGELAGEDLPASREVEDLLHRFFSDLMARKNPREHILPEYRSLLLPMLEDLIAREGSLSEVRLGRVCLSSDGGSTAMARVLLLGDSGRALGDIAADRQEGLWYVSGFFIDLADLDRPQEPLPLGSFEPPWDRWPF